MPRRSRGGQRCLHLARAIDQDFEVVHAAEQVLLRLQAVERARSIATASARAGSRARSAASWPRCARDAADRRGRCRRRDRSRPSASSRAARPAPRPRRARCRRLPACDSGAATSTSRLRSLSRRDGVISSSMSRRRFCRSSITASRTRAMARLGGAPFASSSASNNNVTSSSRTGPSARVMRRTRLSARSSASASARAPSTGSASRSRRDATRAWCTEISSPACAAGMAVSSETSR